jgi:Fe-S-cluster-containing dehydrogenase component
MIIQFSVHPEKCVGCASCVAACVNENQIDVDDMKPYRLLMKNEYDDKIDGERIVYFTVACMHCKERPCAKKCPKNCFRSDPETGLNILDPENCVGCRACASVCPFGAIQFYAPKNGAKKAAKCNGCLARVRSGRPPACVSACPIRAVAADEKNRVLLECERALLNELKIYNGAFANS